MHRIGTAGWSVPADEDKQETRLHHYSRTFSCVEVNSSFSRSHRAATWTKWSQQTPPYFRFSIKAPKTITHQERLRNTAHLLETFFEQIEPMGEKMVRFFFSFRRHFHLISPLRRISFPYCGSFIKGRSP